jgi:hypothetical protein
MTMLRWQEQLYLNDKKYPKEEINLTETDKIFNEIAQAL